MYPIAWSQGTFYTGIQYAQSLPGTRLLAYQWMKQSILACLSPARQEVRCKRSWDAQAGSNMEPNTSNMVWCFTCVRLMANQGTEPECKTSISEKESIKEHFAKPGLEQCIETLCAFFKVWFLHCLHQNHWQTCERCPWALSQMKNIRRKESYKF